MIYPASEIANQPQCQPTVHTGWALLHESVIVSSLNTATSKFSPSSHRWHRPFLMSYLPPHRGSHLPCPPAFQCRSRLPSFSTWPLLPLDSTSVAPPFRMSVAPTPEPVLHRVWGRAFLLAGFCLPLCSANDVPARRGCVDQLDRRCMRTEP